MRKIGLYVLFISAICFWCIGSAYSSTAFNTMSGIITDNGSGPATTLTDVYEASYGAAWIQSTNPAGSGGYAIIGQPLLDLQQGSTSWEGYGMCVDTAHWLYLGAPHADYHVYDWATAYAQGRQALSNRQAIGTDLRTCGALPPSQAISTEPRCRLPHGKGLPISGIYPQAATGVARICRLPAWILRYIPELVNTSQHPQTTQTHLQTTIVS